MRGNKYVCIQGKSQGLNLWQDTQGTQHFTNWTKVIAKALMDAWLALSVPPLHDFLPHFREICGVSKGAFTHTFTYFLGWQLCVQGHIWEVNALPESGTKGQLWRRMGLVEVNSQTQTNWVQIYSKGTEHEKRIKVWNFCSKKVF